MAEQYAKVAVGDIGTQFFWFNPETSKFEYGLPVTAGAEFGGDTESFEAPETDSDVVAKLVGRTTPNDVQYTVNYTAVKYERILDISDNIKINTYMEVLSDGSAMVFDGTSGTPTITAGDVRQINWTIAPNSLAFVSDIFNLTAKDIARLSKLVNTVYTGTAINIDKTTIPTARQQYYASTTNVE